MDKKLKKVFSMIILIAPVFIFFISCATTSLTTWTDPQYSAGPLKKIVVFGLFQKFSDRSLFEGTMVSLLHERGIEAVPSMDLFTPDKNFDRSDSAVKEILNQNAINGILIIKMLPLERNTYYVPGELRFYYNPFWRYWDFMRDPGYIITSTSVKLEIRLFGDVSERMIWAGETETLNPQSLEDMAGPVCEKIIENLAVQKLIIIQNVR